jgi:NAD(P)-dependent dehydrogenase (short-subunit alcohol dehydrogenase family)
VRGATAIAIYPDGASEATTVRAFDTVEHELGRLTALVNNAATNYKAPRAAPAGSDLQRFFAASVIGTRLRFLEALRRRGIAEGGPGGAIVCV